MKYDTMKLTQMPPVHAANRVANSGNTAYGVDVLCWRIYSAIGCTTVDLLPTRINEI